jgi:hypothetical protein
MVALVWLDLEQNSAPSTPKLADYIRLPMSSISQAVHEFRISRNVAKEQPQCATLALAALMIAIGISTVTTLAVLCTFENTITSSVVATSAAVSCCGILLATTVDLDWNRLIHNQPIISCTALAACFVSGGYLCATFHSAFLFMAVPPAWYFYRGSNIPVESIVISILFYFIGVGAMYLRCDSIGRIGKGLARTHEGHLEWCRVPLGDPSNFIGHGRLLGGGCLFFSCATACLLRALKRNTKISSTVATIIPCYFLVLASGLEILYSGILRSALVDVTFGTLLCISAVIVARYRNSIYGCVSKWLQACFEQAQKVRDGAFFVELLDSNQANLRRGSKYWVQRSALGRGVLTTINEDDPHRHWVEGVISSVERVHSRRSSASQLVTVQLPDKTIHQFRTCCTYRSTAEAILRQATKAVRCVSWRHVTRDLLRSNSSSKAAFSFSRPLAKGERIDAFVSHSWHDEPDDKFRQLQVWAANFEAKHGREPTLWFDRFCLDQSAITESLRMLPVNVLAADRLLVVHGPTYHRRLWCMLEIFCCFAFAPQASDRVEIAAGSTCGAAMSSLAAFDLARAHCFDPNEEQKLREVINALGEKAFVDSVQNLAGRLRNSS